MFQTFEVRVELFELVAERFEFSFGVVIVGVLFELVSEGAVISEGVFHIDRSLIIILDLEVAQVLLLLLTLLFQNVVFVF